MMTPALAHDLTALSAAVALTAHCRRRHEGHTRRVLCALRCQHDHVGATMTDDDARTVANYYRARREYWRALLTTDVVDITNDEAEAVAAVQRNGYIGAHAPWADCED